MMQIVQKPVADGNWRPGKVPRAVRAVVLHVAEGTAAAVHSWFNTVRPDAPSSAQFLVGLDGTIYQYVGLHDIAYHAGVFDHPTWPGFVDNNTNATTVGIEHEGSGLTPWPEAQVMASAFLSAWICERFAFPADALHFPPHHTIRASKSCPGPAFSLSAYLAHVQSVRTLFGADVKKLIVGIR